MSTINNKAAIAIATQFAAECKVTNIEDITGALIAYGTGDELGRKCTVKLFCTLSKLPRKKVNKAKLDELVQAMLKWTDGKPNRREFAKQWRAYAVKLITRAEHNRKTIIELCVAKFDGQLTVSAISTYLSDAKNEKYYATCCKLECKVIVLENKALAFVNLTNK